MIRHRTIAVDFDGVIRNKETNEAVEGSLDAIRELSSSYKVIIFTCRGDSEWVKIWMEDHEFPSLPVTNKKPVAFAYIDDHAVRFEGKWDATIRDLSLYETGWQDNLPPKQEQEDPMDELLRWQ